jgi:hypothetical protein
MNGYGERPGSRSISRQSRKTICRNARCSWPGQVAGLGEAHSILWGESNNVQARHDRWRSSFVAKLHHINEHSDKFVYRPVTFHFFLTGM